MNQETLSLRSRRRGLMEITGEVGRVVSESGVRHGLCNVFVRHTSASLVLNENADPSARMDLEEFLNRLVPERQSWFTHVLEGADDMPSHIKTALTQSSVSIPVARGRLALGTWQGIYLWEHRDRPHNRDVVVTVTGE